LKIAFKELTEQVATFVIDDVDPSFVNALRRTLMMDVPKMAIEDVEFHLGPIRDSSGKEYESISPLFDEIVSQRLGMIPIPTDLELFNFREECKCGGEGCPNCTIMYTLNKRGPCTVYSGDLEPLSGDQYAIKDQLIPIMKLTDGQAPLIYATAILGTGRKHAKWQVTSGVGYKYYPEITVDNRKIRNPEQIVTNCPQNVYTLKGKNLEVSNPEECVLCRTCQDYAPNAIDIQADETKFIFTFETDGSVTTIDALKFSLNLLSEKFNEFRDKVSDIS
jgi:DNA-directed RNA polymerase subunit D